MTTPFLTARWQNLINITYPVSPNLLLPYTPRGVDLDIQNGTAFCSFVAFDFQKTRLLGIPIPFHTQFPEINLRFYVKYRGKNAVCFVREFVPKAAVAYLAQWIYNEPYQHIRMQTQSEFIDTELHVQHHFWVKHQAYSVAVVADKNSYRPAANTTEHYFKEHDLGFGKDHSGNTTCYTVSHPVWNVYHIKKYDLSVDFGAVYGKQWQILNHTEPLNVLLAQGSSVAVYPKEMV